MCLQIYSSGPGTKLNEQIKLPPYPWKIILLNFCCNLDEHKEQKYLDQLKWDSTFQKYPLRCIFQICSLQIRLKPIVKMSKGNDFSKVFK